jgi:hypothetical protein
MTNQTVKAKPGPKPGRKMGRPARKKEVVTFAAPTPTAAVSHAVPASQEAPSKYHRVLNGFWVDIYDILDAYSITNPGDQHAIKKMAMPGGRGVKTANQDREEAIVSLKRAIQLDR